MKKIQELLLLSDENGIITTKLAKKRFSKKKQKLCKLLNFSSWKGRINRKRIQRSLENSKKRKPQDRSNQKDLTNSLSYL